MKISVKYNGTLEELCEKKSAFKRLKTVRIIEHQDRLWSRNHNTSQSYDVQAITIGKTGYGKSTSLNAILGSSVMASSDVSGCTREVQSFEFKIRDGNYFSIADFPGIGESIDLDTEYFQLYKKMLIRSDVVIYLLRADTRDFSIDQHAIKYLFPDDNTRRKLIFALNFCDKIEPISRNLSTSPTIEQLLNINNKIKQIEFLFNPKNKIIPYSAGIGWNIDELCDEIINVISNSDYVQLI